MRKSVQVTLTVAAGVALAACGSNSADRANPCDAATFSEQACQDAIAKGGYFWNGSWYPMNYSHPYPYYYGYGSGYGYGYPYYWGPGIGLYFGRGGWGGRWRR